MYHSMLRNCRSLWHNEDGLTAVEYSVLLGFVAVACIAAVILLGNNLDSTYGTAADATNATAAPAP